MSNQSPHTEHECVVAEGCGAILRIIQPRDKDLGGFSVRRVLPSSQQKMVGPWVFFDHMGPAHFPAGEGINVRPHPHVNIATVTYLFEGEILHRDSVGSHQAIRPGDLNLMVSGSGIVHSERERPEVRDVPHSLHGLQLWLALPAEQEEIDAAFYHYPDTSIPAVVVDGVNVRVMMGTAYGVSSPVKVFADTLYVEADLKAGQTLLLPDAEERALYIAKGAVKAQDTAIAEHAMAVFSAASGVSITATEDARIAIIGGEKMPPRFIEWNFVSSRKQRIEQAKQDWREGRFATVPGDEEEFIPLPE
jgi:redox-sensitive bicupin YhaK (pirin superfamily)